MSGLLTRILPSTRLVCLQEKDRAKFGPEYGDRFCMLQLVGRHEMDKVQLQHESETVQKVRRARALKPHACDSCSACSASWTCEPAPQLRSHNAPSSGLC